MRLPALGNPENAKADVFGTGLHGYTDGSPGVEAPTLVTDDQLNAIVGELLNLTTAFAGAPSGVNDQIAKALQARLASTAFSIEATAFADYDGVTSSGSSVWRGFSSDGAGLIFAVGENAKAADSYNLGRTWNTYTSSNGFSGTYVACAQAKLGGSTWKVAVGADNIQSSLLGANLTQRVSGNSDVMQGVAFGGGKFVAVSNNHVYTSTNGSTWTQFSPSNQPGVFSGRLRYGNGVFMCPTGTGVKVTTVANAGVTWTTYASATAAQPSYVDYHNGAWWAVFGNGTQIWFERSQDDGATWFPVGPRVSDANSLLYCAATATGAFAGHTGVGVTGSPGIAATAVDGAVRRFAQQANSRWVDMVRPDENGSQFLLLGIEIYTPGTIVRSIFTSL